jgi:type III restriction enzyme
VRTKLQDGVRLLEVKREAIERYAEKTGKPLVNPVMLVIAQTIQDAEEASGILRDPAFYAGRYAEAVLTVHSKKPDDELRKLESVEDPDSPARIIVSVGMLKEGWDVKNVYVIASLRALVAEILTEQTLGRGLRLPFGKYTDIELLDTLEVLAHERYEQLLKKTGVINEAFVDYRTRVRVQTDANGDQSARPETIEIGTEVEVGRRERQADARELARA